MCPSQGGAVFTPSCVEKSTQIIDGFLACLVAWERGCADLSDIYTRMVEHGSKYPESELDIPDEVRQALAKSREDAERGTRDGIIPGLGEIIRLVRDWRATARQAADCLPAIGLADQSIAIHTVLDGLERPPVLPPRAHADDFPTPEALAAYLEKEKRAAVDVRAFLERALNRDDGEVESGAPVRHQKQAPPKAGGGDMATPPSRRRGRPVKTDRTKDRRIYEAWQTGQYKTYSGLARELCMKDREVQRAVDRERKRIRRKV